MTPMQKAVSLLAVMAVAVTSYLGRQDPLSVESGGIFLLVLAVALYFVFSKKHPFGPENKEERLQRVERAREKLEGFMEKFEELIVKLGQEKLPSSRSGSPQFFDSQEEAPGPV